MMEQDRHYHIQYKHGVQLDLENAVFDDEEKLTKILDFVASLKQ